MAFDVKVKDIPDPRGEEEVFPSIDPGVEVLGDRVLVQLRRVKTMTNSGFYIPDETQQTLKFNETVAKVVQIGPLAYKFPDTLEPWPEGPWCKVGDIVRTIKYGGDRFVIDAGDDGAPIIFITLQAREIISRAKSFEAAQKMKAFVD
jgi:co-chaperonin GroES (HSP10)